MQASKEHYKTILTKGYLHDKSFFDSVCFSIVLVTFVLRLAGYLTSWKSAGQPAFQSEKYFNVLWCILFSAWCLKSPKFRGPSIFTSIVFTSKV